MGATFRIGRIGGVAVDAHWSLVVVLWLITWSLASYTLPEAASGYTETLYWVAGLLAALGLVSSIIAHELSHAVVANRHGLHVEHITLWMFGGVATLGKQAHDPGTELRVALAGPAMSVALGAACLASAALTAGLGGPDLLGAALGWLGALNLVLAAFNLLPGAPLDGGRVLAAVLWRRSGDERLARKRAARAGQLVGQGLIALGVVELLLTGGIGGLWPALIGWFLVTAARGAEASHLDLVAALDGVPVAQVMTTDVDTLDQDRTVDDFVHHDAMTAHGSAFPVVDRDGRLLGLVTLQRFRQLPVDAWATTTVGAVAVPLDQLAVAAPDEPLTDVLGRAGAGGWVMVVDGARLVGVITPTDVSSALDRFSLTRPARSR